MTREDPPIPRNGKCANCGGPRKHAVWNKYSGDQALLDVFCSSKCCREWHANPLPVPVARRCAGCKCDHDEETAGCYQCESRHAQRARTGRGAAA